MLSSLSRFARTCHTGLWLAVVAAVVAIVPASGQSLLASNPEVIAGSTETVPGLTNGEVFRQGDPFETIVLDDAGNVFFRGRMEFGFVTPWNRVAYFHGSSHDNLTMVIRSADPEPSGTIPNATLNAGTETGLGQNYLMSPTGARVLWGANLSFSAVQLPATENTALYIGNPAGGWSILVQEGDPAPGTPGCAYATNFTSVSTLNLGVLDDGTVMYRSALTGGDVSGSNDDDAVFSGPQGSPALVMREERTALDSGELIGELGQLSQLNSSGSLLLDATLDTELGSPPATTADDRVLFLYEQANGLQVLVREGDPAPGIPGGVTFGTPSGSWNIYTGLCAFNASGASAIRAGLVGPGVTPGLDDEALYVVSLAGHTLVLRRGDSAPGIPGATINALSHATIGINDAGVVTFASSLSGAVTVADNTALWSGQPGALQLVAREGDPAPGTGGSLFGDTYGRPTSMNNAGQVLFRNTLSGGDAPGTSLWAWDPVCGLRAVMLTGDIVEYIPGSFGAAFGLSNPPTNNGYGRPMSFADDGTLALRVLVNNGSLSLVAVVVVHVDGCSPPPTSYCTAAPNSAGCVPSIFWSGEPTLFGADDFVVQADQVLPQRPGLLFWGISGAANLPFQGGTLCVQPPLKRNLPLLSGGTPPCGGLYTEPFTQALMAQSGFVSGQQVWSQFWMRDPASLSGSGVSFSDGLHFTVQ